MNRLRELRHQRGLAMWALAARSRVQPSQLLGIERHDYLPGRIIRDRIAAALGVPVLEIWPELAAEPANAARTR